MLSRIKRFADRHVRHCLDGETLRSPLIDAHARSAAVRYCERHLETTLPMRPGLEVMRVPQCRQRLVRPQPSAPAQDVSQSSRAQIQFFGCSSCRGLYGGVRQLPASESSSCAVGAVRGTPRRETDEIRAMGLRLAELCQKYGIAELSVFGPIARGDERPDSDVDLLYVRLPAMISACPVSPGKRTWKSSSAAPSTWFRKMACTGLSATGSWRTRRSCMQREAPISPTSWKVRGRRLPGWREPRAVGYPSGNIRRP